MKNYHSGVKSEGVIFVDHQMSFLMNLCVFVQLLYVMFYEDA